MSENSRINPDIIVIGAGMTGSMVTKVIRSNGMKVLLLDCKKPLSGSKCSSGMWREGWIGQKIREQYEEGIEILHEHAGINIIECENLDPVKEKKTVGRPSLKPKEVKKRMDELMYVDWRDICNLDSDNMEVLGITNNIVYCQSTVRGNHNEKLKSQFVARMGVFICAGAYTDEILEKSGLPTLGLDKYFGSCIEAIDQSTPNSIIKTWAPYKQMLAARVSASVMKFSDGSMVKNPPEELDERCSNVHDRLKLHISDVMGKKYQLKGVKDIYGLRPYHNKEHKGDFINQHDTNLFSCTGTAKNTTVLCGYLAKKALEVAQDWQVAMRVREKKLKKAQSSSK